MKELLIEPNCSIVDALKILDKTAKRCLLVVNKKGELIGSLTDGDIRRGILKGINFNESVKKVYFSSPKSLRAGSFLKGDAVRMMQKESLEFLPVVDKNNCVIKILHFEELFKSSPKRKIDLDIPLVIMAGGRGTRLEPFTSVLPKPLVPIQDKPIIEHIIDNYLSYGVKTFFMTVNYKSKILKAYFEELDPDYEITFLEEEEPLGTAGSLIFLKDLVKEPFFVTNCDLILKVDYQEFYNFHSKNKFDFSLVASLKNYTIPYGTCNLNPDGSLHSIDEKPEFSSQVNTGVYLINPEVLDLLKEKKYLDMDELISKLISLDMRIGVFPVEEDSWLDIGQWSEYKNTIKKFDEQV